MNTFNILINIYLFLNRIQSIDNVCKPNQCLFGHDFKNKANIEIIKIQVRCFFTVYAITKSNDAKTFFR